MKEIEFIFCAFEVVSVVAAAKYHCRNVHRFSGGVARPMITAKNRWKIVSPFLDTC